MVGGGGSSDVLYYMLSSFVRAQCAVISLERGSKASAPSKKKKKGRYDQCNVQCPEQSTSARGMSEWAGAKG